MIHAYIHCYTSKCISRDVRLCFLYCFLFIWSTRPVAVGFADPPSLLPEGGWSISNDQSKKCISIHEQSIKLKSRVIFHDRMFTFTITVTKLSILRISFKKLNLLLPSTSPSPSTILFLLRLSFGEPCLAIIVPRGTSWADQFLFMPHSQRLIYFHPEIT